MTQITEDPTEANVWELSGLDRCDACGAQAYVRATLTTGDLLFCAHHAAQFREKLAETVLEWHDESDRLLASA